VKNCPPGIAISMICLVSSSDAMIIRQGIGGIGCLGCRHTVRTTSTSLNSIFPGVNPSDVNVHTEANLLTITGERKGEEKGPEYRETFYGKFERQIALPQGVEADKITARYEQGVLEIHVPLSAQLVGRKVPIQIEQNKKIDSKAA
jgi:hypothetical protein